MNNFDIMVTWGDETLFQLRCFCLASKFTVYVFVLLYLNFDGKI